MVYLVGIIGLICGFFAGQTLLLFLLRNHSREEIINILKTDRARKFKYGLLNWLIAIIGAVTFIAMYNTYYGQH